MAKLDAANTFEPMWQWSPTRLTLVGGGRPLDGPLGIAVAEVEPELRIVLTGGDELVGVGVDPGRDPQQDVGRGSDPLLVEHVEAVELVERVDDDVTHTGRDRLTQLVDALVVAVQHARRGGHAGRQRDVELTAGRDVEQHPLLVREPRHRPAQERLRGVDGTLVTERGDGLAAARPQVRLVVDEQRCAELGRQLLDRAPTDRQPPVGTDVGGVGEQSAGERAHPPNVPGVTSARALRCRATPSRGRGSGRPGRRAPAGSCATARRRAARDSARRRR